MHIMFINSWIFGLWTLCCWCDWIIMYNDNNKQCTTLDDCQQRHSTWWYKSSEISDIQLSNWNSFDTFEFFLIHTECDWSQFFDKQHDRIWFWHFANPSETVGQSSSFHRMHNIIITKQNSANDIVRWHSNCHTSSLISNNHNNHWRRSPSQYCNFYLDILIWNTKWDL